LTGVLPLGAFLAEHVWTNSFSVVGPQAFNEAVEHLQSMTYILFLEVGLIGLPLLYHSLYGIVISLQGRPNGLNYTYARNWMYTLQRVSGVILLFYIGWHVWGTRITNAMNGKMVTYEYMNAYLSSPGMLVWYIVGLASACFHFANGLWAFLIGWGVTVSQRSMRWSGLVCTAVGIVIFLMGLNSVLGFFGKGLYLNFA
jgi:succinate dehydrogenase / fumarate reductase cytochrome b subunit